MANAVKGPVIRNMIADYLNVGTDGTPQYAKMGKGFNSLNESPNAQSEERAYIDAKSKTKTTTGYATLEKRVCALETAAAVNVQADADWRRYTNAEFVHQPKAYINESIVVCQQCGCRNGSCGCGGHGCGGHGHRDEWGCRA